MIGKKAVKLQDLISNYPLKDFFTSDEYGLFYSMAPHGTIGQERLPGRQKAKEGLTILPCTNADGLENPVGI